MVKVKQITSLVLAMSIIWLFTDRSVSTLQFDIKVSGAIKVSLAPEIQNKQLQSNVIGDKVRVVIFGLNRETFIGKIVIVEAEGGDATVGEITGIVGADPDANSVDVKINKVTQPKNVRVRINEEIL